LQSNGNLKLKEKNKISLGKPNTIFENKIKNLAYRAREGGGGQTGYWSCVCYNTATCVVHYRTQTRQENPRHDKVPVSLLVGETD